MELEIRVRLEEHEFAEYARRIDWSATKRVCDLTFGHTGATSMQTHGWVIRLRQTDAQTRIEYKAPADPTWTAWIEYGTEIQSFQEMVKILKAIGLRPGVLLDRERRTSTQGPVTLALDEVKGLGYFIEIEGQSPNADDPIIADAIQATVTTLGLTGRPSERPYGELALEKLSSDPEFLAQQKHQIELLAG